MRLRNQTPLKLREQIFRSAEPNEEFVILDVRKDQQILYVSIVDKSGAEIAVNAPLPAATLIEQPETGLEDRIATAVDKGQYAAAVALTSNWGDDPSKREKVIAAINLVKTAAPNLAAASTATIAAQAEVKRMLRHAELTAGRGDNPAFVRSAESIRNQAKQSGAAADQRLKEAQANRDSAVASFRGLLGVGTKGANVTTKAFAALPVMAEKFGEPTDLVSLEAPSYSETIEFINSRLPRSRGAQMGYNESRKKMIYRDKNYAYVFDPKDLNLAVKFITSESHASAYYGKNVIFQCRLGKRLIEMWSIGRTAPVMVASFPVRAPDEVEMNKLGKAVSHLIEMFGGQEEAF